MATPKALLRAQEGHSEPQEKQPSSPKDTPSDCPKEEGSDSSYEGVSLEEMGYGNLIKK